MKIRRRFYFIGGSILLAMLITGFGLAAALEIPGGDFATGRGFIVGSVTRMLGNSSYGALISR